MKSAILKSNIFGVLGFAALGFTTAASTVASARPDVCDYDCKGHSKTRVACGLKITWKSQSIKWCDTIDLPKMWACESVRSSACRIGERLEESGAEGPKLHYEKFQMMPYKKLFSNSDNVAVNISLLSRSVDYFNVQMMNANGFNAGFNKTLRTADEDSNVIVEQLQALSDWA